MAPGRQVVLKCCFCQKSVLRCDMVRVTSKAEELSDWCKRLGTEFKANCEKVKNPFLCLIHFPKKKTREPRAHVLPYKHGYQKLVIDYDSDEEEEEGSVEEPFDEDSDDDLYDEDIEEENDTQTIDMSTKFENLFVCWKQILPIISLCLVCWKNGIKKYADVKTEQRGASVNAQMFCSCCENTWEWSSSPVFEEPGRRGPKSYTVNAWLVTAIMTTGNGFSKMKSLFEEMRTPFLCKSRFYEILKRKVEPAIKSIYKNHNSRVLSKVSEAIVQKGPLDIAGDGQYDSRGFSAYICRFSLLDIASKLILDFQVCRKIRGGNSGVLEKMPMANAFLDSFKNSVN